MVIPLVRPASSPRPSVQPPGDDMQNNVAASQRNNARPRTFFTESAARAEAPTIEKQKRRPCPPVAMDRVLASMR